MSIASVRDAFALASGWIVTHAGMSNIGRANILEFDGVDDRGADFHVVSDPFYGDPHTVATSLGSLEKLRILEKLESTLMASPSALAERIKAHKARIAAETDKLWETMDDLVDKTDAAFLNASSAVTAQRDEIESMDAEITQLSNVK